MRSRSADVVKVAVVLGLLSVGMASAQGDRVPGAQWLRYDDVAEAGFDAAGLVAAEKRWDTIPSSAIDGAASVGGAAAVVGCAEKRLSSTSSYVSGAGVARVAVSAGVAASAGAAAGAGVAGAAGFNVVGEGGLTGRSGAGGGGDCCSRARS